MASLSRDDRLRRWSGEAVSVDWRWWSRWPSGDRWRQGRRRQRASRVPAERRQGRSARRRQFVGASRAGFVAKDGRATARQPVEMFRHWCFFDARHETQWCQLCYFSFVQWNGQITFSDSYLTVLLNETKLSLLENGSCALSTGINVLFVISLLAFRQFAWITIEVRLLTTDVIWETDLVKLMTLDQKMVVLLILQFRSEWAENCTLLNIFWLSCQQLVLQLCLSFWRRTQPILGASRIFKMEYLQGIRV